MSPSRPLHSRARAPRPAGLRVVDGAGRSGRGLRIAVAASRFNEEITERLLSGAFDALADAAVAPRDVTLVEVPGAYELPFVARALAASGRHDAVICLGAVIRGGTPHFDFVAGEAARGIARVAEATGVPVLFGVLTTDTRRQAIDRSGGRLGNRGADAARAAVAMAHVARDLRRGKRA